ncbi:MAG: hypothetical protein ACK40L_19860, partial [Hydrogenophaga sp.]
ALRLLAPSLPRHDRAALRRMRPPLSRAGSAPRPPRPPNRRGTVEHHHHRHAEPSTTLRDTTSTAPHGAMITAPRRGSAGGRVVCSHRCAASKQCYAVRTHRCSASGPHRATRIHSNPAPRCAVPPHHAMPD